MKLELYSIFDRLSGTYGMPFTAVNEAVAVRNFKYVGMNSKMVADDMDLYKIGIFDTDTAVITETTPSFVCHFLDVKEV